jgi:hypothetical protein
MVYTIKGCNGVEIIIRGLGCYITTRSAGNATSEYDPSVIKHVRQNLISNIFFARMDVFGNWRSGTLSIQLDSQLGRSGWRHTILDHQKTTVSSLVRVRVMHKCLVW